MSTNMQDGNLGFSYCFQLLNDWLSRLPKDPKSADALYFRQPRELFDCYLRAASHTFIDYASKHS